MRAFDVANGDADGLFGLHQLRLADPLDAPIVTGPKRDIELVARVRAAPGDVVTVVDVSLDRNRAALLELLGLGVRVRWFDHHYAGEIPAHPLLDAHIDTAADVCSSVLADRHLQGRFRAWAVAAAFGDGLTATATQLAAPLGLDAGRLAALRDLGELVNYNAYGECEADLAIAPAALYRSIRPHAEPWSFIAASPILATLRAQRDADLAAAAACTPIRLTDGTAAYLLPDTAWSRRVGGTFANRLAGTHPDRAHAVIGHTVSGERWVSIRAPASRPAGAATFARRFATGGGREASAGIDALPAAELDGFLRAFDAAFTV